MPRSSAWKHINCVPGWRSQTTKTGQQRIICLKVSSSLFGQVWTLRHQKLIRTIDNNNSTGRFWHETYETSRDCCVFVLGGLMDSFSIVFWRVWPQWERYRSHKGLCPKPLAQVGVGLPCVDIKMVESDATLLRDLKVNTSACRMRILW